MNVPSDSSARVLIVEDDSTLLRGLSDNFRNEGFEVLVAQDGAAGLQSALTEKPDLILLDIMLPKLSGFEVCHELRSQGADCAIIMLTAKGQEQDIVRGLELGADDYVTKPFSIRELLARVRAFLRRRSAGVLESYTFGDCCLDLMAHKLHRDGEEISLTSKEYQLLAYLVSRAGRALTRADILRSVWGSRVVVTERSVDRCITTLRGKVEPDPRHPKFIRTIRDVGYRFEME